MEIAGHIATASPYSRPVFVKRTPVPDSVQSSVDSLVTMEPSSRSTSTPDLWASPGSDTSSYTEQPSPEQHSGAHMVKRNSVFNLRNRSNTLNSTSSSSAAVTAPNMPGHEHTSHRLSQDLRHLAGQSIVEINSAKRSLFRGKKGKRQSESFSPSSPPHEAGETDASRRTSILRKNKKPSLSSESSTHDSKPRISSPFDFKHLTHTDRHQFASLTGASENELVAGFHNLSTSQTPRRDLTGIKADDLRLRNLSAEGLVSTGTQPFSPMILKSPMSLRSPQEESMPFPIPATEQPPSRPPLRTARSVESFSRPGVNPRMHRHTQSANTNSNPLPPPRTTSRLAMAPIHDLPEDSSDVPRAPSTGRRSSGVWTHLASTPQQSPAAGGLLPSMMEESDYVGHALTTPDNSAIHPVTTPPFALGLDDVAEEPERFASPRPAPLPPIRAGAGAATTTAIPTSPIRTSLENFSFNNPRASPTSRPSHTRKVSFTSPKAAVSSGSARPTHSRPLSQCSDTLGSLGGSGGAASAVRRRPSLGRRMSVRRKSNTWRVSEESWEDDIDYIYDNALEADCDLEWDCASSTYSTTTTPAYHDEEPSSTTPPSRPTLVVPPPQPQTTTTTPSSSEPEMRSAVSASTISTTGISTPSSDLYHHHQLPPHPLTLTTSSTSYHTASEEPFALTPSLLIPQEYKHHPHHLPSDAYITTDDILSHYDPHTFPVLIPTTHHHHHHHHHSTANSSSLRKSISSTQSSHFRSSKRSSYDSSLVSGGSTTSGGGMRRSASSAGSLPDLVPSSRNARRDFDAVVERLEGEVVAFGAFVEGGREEGGSEDEESTTFFTDAEEEEDGEEEEDVEADVKSSLELARRGHGLHYAKHSSLSASAAAVPVRRSRAASGGVRQQRMR